MIKILNDSGEKTTIVPWIYAMYGRKNEYTPMYTIALYDMQTIK